MDNVSIVKRLTCDQKFRRQFFASPREVLRVAGIAVTEEDLKKIEAVDWANISCPNTSFDDDEVLRMSVGY